jgi:hypothetical protein
MSVTVISVVIVISVLVLLLFVSLAFAQDYDLSWWTVDGGGGTFSQGGSYTLGGTIGQPDAGLLSGGNYTLGGGFWGGGALAEAPAGSGIYLPLVMKNQ